MFLPPAEVHLRPLRARRREDPPCGTAGSQNVFIDLLSGDNVIMILVLEQLVISASHGSCLGCFVTKFLQVYGH